MKKLRVLFAVMFGLLVVLAVGSYAVAGGSKDRVKAGPMSGYFEGAAGGPVSSVATGNFRGHDRRRGPGDPLHAVLLGARG